MTSLDVVVVNYKTPDMVLEFFMSLSVYFPFETVIETVTMMDVAAQTPIGIAMDTYHYISTEENCGYALACNRGAAEGDADVIAFFNADTSFANTNCIDYCCKFLADHDDVGIVGPLQTNHAGLVTASGFFGDVANPSEPGWKSNTPGRYREDKKAVYVSGSALFIKREVWNLLRDCPTYRNSFPLSNGAMLPVFLYYEDQWLCRHAEAHGFETWFLGSAVMNHEWHGSSPVGSQASVVPLSHQVFEKACHDHDIAC